MQGVKAGQPTLPLAINPLRNKGLIAGQKLRETNGFHKPLSNKAGYVWGALLGGWSHDL